MNPLTAYQFEEEPVRVIMIAGTPWFVANDVCRVLDIKNSRDALSRLEEDERGVGITDTLGGQQDINIISESGLYALIFRSRRPDAKRFRRWVTGEVLPSIRRTGNYALQGHEPAPEQPLDFDPPRMLATISVVREARRLFGPRSARSIWLQLGLPVAVTDSVPNAEGDPLAEPLKEWLAGRASITVTEACQGLRVMDNDISVRRRIGALLRLFGWSNRVLRVEGHNTRVWTPGQEA